jgi:hypothetical protein
LKEKDLVVDLINQYKLVCNCSIIDDHSKRLFKEALMRLLPDSKSFTYFQNESTTQQHVEPEKMHVEESNAKGSAFSKTESLELVSSETNTMQNTQSKIDTEKSLRKTKKRSAFSLKDLMDELHLEMDPNFVPVICKTVCTRFGKEHPKSERFSRQRRIYFYPDDRNRLKQMIQEEYSRYLSRKSQT